MTKDLALGALALLLAALYISATGTIPRSALGDSVGAGGVPLILGWALAAAGIVLMAHHLLLRWKGAYAPPELSEAFRTPLRTAGVAAGVVAIATLFIFALEWLGYLASVALFLTAILVYQGMRPSLRMAVVAVLGSVCLWLLFDAFLGIDLPSGVLPEII